MAARRTIFQRKPEPPSIEESLAFLAQGGEDARLGDEDGVDGQAQLGGGLVGGGPFQGDPAEGGPGGRLEARPDHLQEALRHVAVVLLVPQAARLAARVLELLEQVEEIAVAGADGPMALTLPVVAQAVDGDALEPAAEGAGPLVLEV